MQLVEEEWAKFKETKGWTARTLGDKYEVFYKNWLFTEWKDPHFKKWLFYDCTQTFLHQAIKHKYFPELQVIFKKYYDNRSYGQSKQSLM